MTLINSLNSLQNPHSIALLFGSTDQCLHVLREARTAIATTRIEELRADTRISTNTLAHHVDVRTHDLAQISDVVHKRNARCQHRICRILDHLSRRHIGENHTVIVHHKGFIQALHQLLSTLALDTYNHTVGLHKIVDSVALLQKFGVRRHIKFDLHTTCSQLLSHCLLDPLRRTHGHRALGYQQSVAIDLAAELARHLQNIAQVGTAVLVGRRSDGTEHNLDLVQALAQLGRKVQTTVGHIACDQLFKTRFIDWDLPLSEHFDLTFIDINTGHIGTHLGEARPRHQPDITRTYDCYLHT